MGAQQLTAECSSGAAFLLGSPRLSASLRQGVLLLKLVAAPAPGPRPRAATFLFAAPVTCTAALGAGVRCPRPGAGDQGAGRARAAAGSFLPSPHPTRSPSAPPPHTPLPCALRRVVRHLGRGVRSCPAAEPARPAERERRRGRSPAAAISAFCVGWTPATRWDPLLSPAPLTATFPALGHWRSGKLGPAWPAGSRRATWGPGVRGQPGGARRGLRPGAVGGAAGALGPPHLSPGRGAGGSRGGRKTGTRGCRSPAARGRAPARRHRKAAPPSQLLFQVSFLLWKLKGLRHKPVSPGARGRVCWFGCPKNKLVLQGWFKCQLLFFPLSRSPQANVKSETK